MIKKFGNAHILNTLFRLDYPWNNGKTILERYTFLGPQWYSKRSISVYNQGKKKLDLFKFSAFSRFFNCDLMGYRDAILLRKKASCSNLMMLYNFVIYFLSLPMTGAKMAPWKPWKTFPGALKTEPSWSASAISYTIALKNFQ